MRPLPVQTEDLSYTLFSEQFGEHYHSLFGARNESIHVFIEAGFRFWQSKISEPAHRPVSVLEIGFGTGFNAWLTAIEAEQTRTPVLYETIEQFPIDTELARSLYPDPQFLSLHEAVWEQPVSISPYFTLHKRTADLLRCSFSRAYDVVFFDAFSPNVQPELWTEEVFLRIATVMSPGAILTTYCAKGEVRRTIQRAGLHPERIPGPRGKREMLRATAPFL
jgi:tRNA U34 5-methylaminomethyl-2-thiouridine-forming methyltransferase MnmC